MGERWCSRCWRCMPKDKVTTTVNGTIVCRLGCAKRKPQKID